MQMIVQSAKVFAATGGRDSAASAPLVVFLHGAGMDHSVWALPARALAYAGYRVLAVDLPGHGASEGPPLTSVAALADWTAALIEAAGGPAALVGHSMGALIALATAARHPEGVSRIALVGVGVRMPVHPDLLAAAKADDQDAVDMVSLWGLGGPATRGGSPSPGLWMLGGVSRLLERAPEGALYADLAACNAYSEAQADAALVRCPALLLLGEGDQMTPLKSGRALAEKIAGATTRVLAGAGHMPMIEKPDETLDALRTFIAARAPEIRPS
jgi:pimeloyl-ACP methyl ester carboxylesterase